MKLIRISDQKIGLLVLLPEGPHAIDITGSLGVFAPHDPLSIGLLNGTLKGGCDWSLIVRHWAHLRLALRKLAGVAIANPDHPRLVLQPIGQDPRTRDALDPIVALEITDVESLEQHDPTGRRTMERQFGSPPADALPLNATTTMTETAQVIEFSSSGRGDTARR